MFSLTCKCTYLDDIIYGSFVLGKECRKYYVHIEHIEEKDTDKKTAKNFKNKLN